MKYPEKVERRPDRIAAMRYPDKVERLPNPDVRYPEKVERRADPDVRCPGGMSENFCPGRMRDATCRKGPSACPREREPRGNF